MPEIVIIGAGMAGLACGQRLMAAGHHPVLLDKGRGAGGRMATRRIMTDAGEIGFDHGAQYFTAHDPAFENQVALWAEAGLVERWTAAGEGAWVGSPAMNAPLKTMARSLDVRWSTRVTALSRAGNVWTVVTDNGEALMPQAVVLALPAEQSADLLAPVAPDFAGRAQSVRSAPCWTVMLGFADRLNTAEDCLRGDDDAVLGWAARNCSKPGRGQGETWVIQAGSGWSRRNLEHSPHDVEAAAMLALATRLDITLPVPIVRTSHRWRFARSGTDGSGILCNPDLSLGVCGDWLLGPRVENAWLSGVRMADRLALTLAKQGLT